MFILLFRVFNIACKWPFNRVPSYKITFSPTRNFGMQSEFFLFFLPFSTTNLSSFGCERQDGVPTLFRISFKRNGFLKFNAKRWCDCMRNKAILMLLIFAFDSYFIVIWFFYCIKDGVFLSEKWKWITILRMVIKCQRIAKKFHNFFPFIVIYNALWVNIGEIRTVLNPFILIIPLEFLQKYLNGNCLFCSDWRKHFFFVPSENSELKLVTKSQNTHMQNSKHNNI